MDNVLILVLFKACGLEHNVEECCFKLHGCNIWLVARGSIVSSATVATIERREFTCPRITMHHNASPYVKTLQYGAQVELYYYGCICGNYIACNLPRSKYLIIAGIAICCNVV